MREGIKTSLLSILCVIATAAATAAPAVRTIGGTDTYTYDSAAAATAASRAGSLRSTGGYIRPTTTVSTSGVAAHPATSTTTATITPTSGGSVSAGGGTVGRVASTPRLSIGKYIGAPKSVSSSGGTSSDLTERVERLESTVIRLESDKQDTLSGSDYIIVDQENQEVILDLDAVRDDLGFEDREIEFMDDETGLYWRFVGEGDDAWRTVITWEALNQHLDLSDINTQIATAINDLRTEIANTYATTADLSDYVPYQVGTGENNQDVGKAMVINDQGRLVPTSISVDTTGFVTTDQLNSAIDGLDSTYVTIHQGTGDNGELVGSTMIIDSNGDLKPGNYDDVYVSQYQGTGTDDELVGRPMVIDEDGYVVPSEVDFATVDDLDNLGLGALAYKDTVGSADIDSSSVTTAKIADGAVTTAKLDSGINTTLSGANFWEQWWNDHKDELESGDYVVAVTPNTNASNPPQLFRIITAPESTDDPDSGLDTSTP